MFCDDIGESRGSGPWDPDTQLTVGLSAVCEAAYPRRWLIDLFYDIIFDHLLYFLFQFWLQVDWTFSWGMHDWFCIWVEHYVVFTWEVSDSVKLFRVLFDEIFSAFYFGSAQGYGRGVDGTI